MTRLLIALSILTLCGCSSPTAPERVARNPAFLAAGNVTCSGDAVLLRLTGFGPNDVTLPGPLAEGEFYETSIETPTFATFGPAAYWYLWEGRYGEAHAYTSRYRLSLRGLEVSGGLACTGTGIDGEGNRWHFFDVRGLVVNGVAIQFQEGYHRHVIGRWTVHVNESGADWARAVRIEGHGKREVVLGETRYACQ